jgi:hypothetical protein
MSYFADLTPHTYTPTGDQPVLNVGWLDSAYPFCRGETTAEFRHALHQLCQRPIWLARGFHECPFCPLVLRWWPLANLRVWLWPPARPPRLGNGQIRIKGGAGVWYAAPTLVEHYVVVHQYLPPAEFVQAVLSPAAVAGPDDELTGHWTEERS